MVAINLFGKKWDFDNNTVKYIGCGLAVFYVIRIVKFLVQRTLNGMNTNPLTPLVKEEVILASDFQNRSHRQN